MRDDRDRRRRRGRRSSSSLAGWQAAALAIGAFRCCLCLLARRPTGRPPRTVCDRCLQSLPLGSRWQQQRLLLLPSARPRPHVDVDDGGGGGDVCASVVGGAAVLSVRSRFSFIFYDIFACTCRRVWADLRRRRAEIGLGGGNLLASPGRSSERVDSTLNVCGGGCGRRLRRRRLLVASCCRPLVSITPPETRGWHPACQPS